MGVLSDKTVIAYRGESAQYAELAPFSPAQRYPEYAFADTAAEPNPAYEAVRGCFHTAGLDAAHFGAAEWNPLRLLSGIEHSHPPAPI